MKTVTVLLSTYNGEAYLPALLDSLYAQRDMRVRILVRDDGSADGTADILRREQREGRLRWYRGENLGPAGSFFDLMAAAPRSDWYAFCDQDDLWLPDKLSRALEMLGDDEPGRPALYYGRPKLVDAQLHPLPSTPRALETMTTLGAALVASNATGCTMVFNRALLSILVSRPPEWVFMHDDWAHKVCLLAGGRLVFDPEVPILYRQHGGNCIGTSVSDLEKLRGHLRSLIRKDRVRSRTAAQLLACFGERMTPEDRTLVRTAARYGESLSARVRLLREGRIRTGYHARDALFLLAAAMKAY